ncbi:MAG: hypothetical protein CVV02_06245 [Firmicutes bacterium HGW-Firmicutes-7]|nr:MAG: hypothetical protein CVV02_06245 [Firmicutes bacterium HGW-Firmicutes-7]
MERDKKEIKEVMLIPHEPIEPKHTKANKGKRVALIGLGVILGGFLLSILYLYMNTFEINYELQTVAQFWDENNLTEQFITKGNELELVLPENVVNTELMLYLKKSPLSKHYEISNAQVDFSNKMININGRIYGIKLPIRMRINPYLEGDRIIISLDNITIGKGQIKLNEGVSNKLKNFLFNDSLPMIIDSKTLFKSAAINISGLEWSEESFKVYAQINDALMIEELKIVRRMANPEILSKFENSDIEAESLAANYINNIEALTKQDIEILIKDILSDSKILNNILIIAEQTTAERIFEKYGTNFKRSNQAEITEKRNKLLGMSLLPYRDLLLENLNNIYFQQEPMHINKGQLYSVSSGRYLTVQVICEEQNINIPEETMKRLSFYYEKTYESLLISYKLDENNYLIMNEDKVASMRADEYLKNNEFVATGRVSFVNDIETWNGVLKEVNLYFQTEEVFIRYMKADDKYAFVVASPKYNYQAFKVMTFVKNDEDWELLEGDIQSISELSKKYPDFNLETATMEIEKVTIYNLGDDMYDVILEDLENKDVIASKNSYTIEYCSYGNQYIYFMLSDGREYVYKVYSMYLQTVYDKETAEKVLEDLPEIITLQESPVM